MPAINLELQKELRNNIETSFGNLFELLLYMPHAYKLCAQINEAFTRYASNAQILTENQKGEFTQL